MWRRMERLEGVDKSDMECACVCVWHTIFDIYIPFQRSMSAVKVSPSFLCDKSVRCNATQKCKDISGVFNSAVEAPIFTS